MAIPSPQLGPSAGPALPPGLPGLPPGIPGGPQLGPNGPQGPSPFGPPPNAQGAGPAPGAPSFSGKAAKQAGCGEKLDQLG